MTAFNSDTPHPLSDPKSAEDEFTVIQTPYDDHQKHLMDWLSNTELELRKKEPQGLAIPVDQTIQSAPSSSPNHEKVSEGSITTITSQPEPQFQPIVETSRKWPRPHLLFQLMIPILIAVCSLYGLYDWEGSNIPADFPALANIHNHRVDQLFNQTVLASALSVKITEVETVTADFANAIAGSSLQGRESLEKDLISFRAKLEMTAEHLQDFEGKVTTALSDMIATLEDAEYTVHGVSISWSRFFRRTTNQRLSDKYQEALRVCSEALRVVFVEAQGLKRELKQLKHENQSIRKKIASESSILDDEKASFHSLWVALGFHKEFLDKYPKNRELLDHVEQYLSEAYKVTVSALSTLASLKGDIDALRTKSTAIDLQPTAPLEEQLKSIQQTLSRFRISKSRQLMGGTERVFGVEGDYQPAHITRV